MRLPPPWLAVELRGGGIWAGTTTVHACSPSCTARLFYRLAEKSGGIPDGTEPPKLASGQPFR